MNVKAENVVEMIARMSDEEKQKTANLLVTKWAHLAKSFVGMIDAEMQDADVTVPVPFPGEYDYTYYVDYDAEGSNVSAA
tara:strand:- start:2453 stop:2692 length:240 start_codon:yes stop_codon:yes gene_type:complete